jgi:competence protein ComEC
VLDVGQGLSTLVEFPDDTVMLVDGGGFFDDSFDVGRLVVAPFLRNRGIERIDQVVLSHDHPDHRNGLRFVLAHFEIGSLWESGLTDSGQGFTELAAIARLRGIPVHRITELPETQALGPCAVHILHPTPAGASAHRPGEDLNNVSIVLQIDHGRTHLVLPGDIDQATERLVFAHRHCPGRVLLVAPHHGSERSNGTQLIQRLKPQAVAIPCGFDNWFGFPSPGVLERYRNAGASLYRTDWHGAILASSNGEYWTIRTMAEHPEEGPR